MRSAQSKTSKLEIEQPECRVLTDNMPKLKHLYQSIGEARDLCRNGVQRKMSQHLEASLISNQIIPPNLYVMPFTSLQILRLSCSLSNQSDLIFEVRQVHGWNTRILSEEAEKAVRSPFRVLIA